MSPRPGSSPSGELRRGYRRPLRRDRALWVALGLSAVMVVLEYALSSPSTPMGWVAFALIAAALAALVVTLVGIAVGVVRGFADGWRSKRSRHVVPHSGGDAAPPAAGG